MKSDINTSGAHFLGIGILLFCGFIVSCDNSIDPIDKETGIFAISGVLDLNEQTNYIRVRDLNVPFTAEATREIDAEVTLENMQTGSVQVLGSERQQYEDIYVHNFLYKNEVTPDTEYRLTVERANGVAVNIAITTPNQPDPQVGPLNQNCYVPVQFELEPINGGTVVLRIGLGPNEGSFWGRQHILKPDDSQGPEKITFTFTADEQVRDVLPGNVSERRCGQYLTDGNIYLSYIHFGPGFYGQIDTETADAIETQRIGALYYDTLAIPVDTSPVCPQDC